MTRMLATLAHRLQERLAFRFLTRLVASPRGRAFQLAWMADAEVSDEGVFDDMMERAADPDVQKMIRIHRDDEQRHARLLGECVARTGVRPEPLPHDLRIIQRIDRMLGGAIQAFLGDKHAGIMAAYALLQVVEERGVEQFPHVARALARVDPESAAVVTSIIRDEERHVRYARAISKRTAPDPATLGQSLRHFREIEARSFADHNRAFLRFAVEHDLLAVRGPERLFWRLVAAWTDAPAAAATEARSRAAA
jgi:rubrerythrin